FASTAYLACPLLLVIWTAPQVLKIYSSVSLGLLGAVFGFGVGWGIGALTFGLGVASVGVALGFAVILGLAASVGTVIPLLMQGQGHLSVGRVSVCLVSVGIMLAGVAVCSFAGKWKEQASDKEAVLSYRTGITVCIISGLLSGCGNLGFVFGAPLVDRAQILGVPSFAASNVV